MRATVGLLGAVAVLFVGWQALGQAAKSAEPVAVTNGTNESAAAYNMSTGIFEGLGQTFAPALGWVAPIAVVVIALGMLFALTGGGR